MSQVAHVKHNPGLKLNTFQFWTVCKPKSIANTGGLDLLSVYLDRGVIPYTEGGGLVHKPADDLSAYQVVDVGDFVLNNQQAWRGSVGVSFCRGIISPAYLVYEIDKTKLDPTFCGYLFRDKLCVDKFMQCSMSVGDIQRQIKTHHLRKIEIAVPDLEVQRFLGAYLTRETARIDALISKKSRFIELLREKRQAVITHAVTKGLDPKVKMKNSGVEWLGEVPEHWSVRPLKGVVATPITDGPHETPNFLDDGIPFVSAEAVSGGFLNFEKIRGFISLKDHERYSKKYKPKKFDIYMIKSGATTGVTAIVDTDRDFNIWSPLAVIRCGADMSPYFLLFFMRSRSFQEAVALNWSFGTQQNIGMGVIGNLQVTVPPLAEQQAIALHIKGVSGRVDLLVEKTERSIELLKERRTALITAAVTGQIDLQQTDFRKTLQ